MARGSSLVKICVYVFTGHTTSVDTGLYKMRLCVCDLALMRVFPCRRQLLAYYTTTKYDLMKTQKFIHNPKVNQVRSLVAWRLDSEQCLRVQAKG